MINTLSNTIVMSDRTVLSIIALNKLWIPDVLIDIIKDFLYIDTYTVWQKFYKRCLNATIKGMDFDWYDLYDTFGRKRATQWTKGNLYDLPQIQSCTCVTCGESSAYHTNLDGCCEMEWDYHEEGGLQLVEKNEDEDDASYQNQDEEYDW